MADDEEGGKAADASEIIAQYQTSRIRALWTSYKRIFQLTKTGICTLDPSNFKVTNSLSYDEIQKLAPDPKDEDQFTFVAKGTTYQFKTAHRNQMLCQFFECASKATRSYLFVGPMRVQRLRKTGIRVESQISMAAYGLVETNEAGVVLQVYR